MNIVGSPLEAFGIGQSMAAGASPVTGIGLAIKNIVEDARKKGLLQAQSRYQAEGSDLTNIAKETREAVRGREEVTTPFVKPDGTIVPISHPREVTPKTLSSGIDETTAILQGIFGGGENKIVPKTEEGAYRVGQIIPGPDGKQYRVIGGDMNDPDVELVQ